MQAYVSKSFRPVLASRWNPGAPSPGSPLAREGLTKGTWWVGARRINQGDWILLHYDGQVSIQPDDKFHELYTPDHPDIATGRTAHRRWLALPGIARRLGVNIDEVLCEARKIE